MRDYFESVGLAHRREKETRAFPIIVTGDPVTRISTRFAPLENSTQKCAAKTPLTRRESFIDRRRCSSHSSSIYPQRFLVFSSANSYLFPHSSYSRGTILSLHLYPDFRDLCRGFLFREGEEGGTNESVLFDLEVLGDRLDQPDSNFEVIIS